MIWIRNPDRSEIEAMIYRLTIELLRSKDRDQEWRWTGKCTDAYTAFGYASAQEHAEFIAESWAIAVMGAIARG